MKKHPFKKHQLKFLSGLLIIGFLATAIPALWTISSEKVDAASTVGLDIITDGNLMVNGNVNLGNDINDVITMRGLLNNDVFFSKEVARTIQISNSTVANTAGATLTFQGAAGAGIGTGGNLSFIAGSSGSGATGDGGSLSFNAGVSASTNGIGGLVEIISGAGSGTSSSGHVTIQSAIGKNNAGSTDGGPSGTIALRSQDGGSTVTGTSGFSGSVTISSGAGGNLTGAGIGGAAGDISIIGGAGGGSASAATGGAGADINLNAGSGGQGTIPGFGGSVTLQGGNSAQGTGAAVNGGDIIIISGRANATSSTGRGGLVSITAGQGGGTSGNGGGVSIAGGAAAAGNSNGGAVTATGGAGQGSGTGGAFTIRGGGGGSTGAGGSISIIAGSPGNSTGAGGDVTIRGGVTTSGHDGHVYIGDTGTSFVQIGDAVAGLPLGVKFVGRTTYRRITAPVAFSDVNASPTVAQILDAGIFTMTPTAARTFTVPTAQGSLGLVQGLPDGQGTVGDIFEFFIVNNGSAANTLTLVGGAGVTIAGPIIAGGTARYVLCRVTVVTSDAETVTCY